VRPDSASAPRTRSRSPTASKKWLHAPRIHKRKDSRRVARRYYRAPMGSRSHASPVTAVGART
jgi:hypothetical protein